jgi:transcriptional regulator
MYDTTYFKENDKSVLIEFVRDFPLAFLSGSYIDGRPAATQVPMLLVERDGKIFLQGHVMRKTDHHKAFLENPQVLAVFTGPNTYISATWYTDPHGGSTWNYMSVYAHGRIRFTDEAGLRAIMQKLSLHFEKHKSSSPTVFENLPNEYRNQMIPGIDGFEIEVENFRNVFKLSQNRDEQSYRNIIHELSKQGPDAALIAEEMQKRLQSLFATNPDRQQ